MAEYSDFSNDFAMHPDTEDLLSKTGALAVRQAVRNLFFVEKPFHPEIGINANKMLFENFTPITEIAIKRQIVQTLLVYEPRVKVNDIQLIFDDEYGGLNIVLVYTIIASNTVQKINVFVERLR